MSVRINRTSNVEISSELKFQKMASSTASTNRPAINFKKGTTDDAEYTLPQAGAKWETFGKALCCSEKQ